MMDMGPRATAAENVVWHCRFRHASRHERLRRRAVVMDRQSPIGNRKKRQPDRDVLLTLEMSKPLRNPRRHEQPHSRSQDFRVQSTMHYVSEEMSRPTHSARERPAFCRNDFLPANNFRNVVGSQR